MYKPSAPLWIRRLKINPVRGKTICSVTVWAFRRRRGQNWKCPQRWNFRFVSYRNFERVIFRNNFLPWPWKRFLCGFRQKLDMKRRALIRDMRDTGPMLWSKFSAISPNFRPKIGVFLKCQCYDQFFFQNLALFSVKKRQFFREIVWRKYFLKS
jgi:hypothetical protein